MSLFPVGFPPTQEGGGCHEEPPVRSPLKEQSGDFRLISICPMSRYYSPELQHISLHWEMTTMCETRLFVECFPEIPNGITQFLKQGYVFRSASVSCLT